MGGHEAEALCARPDNQQGPSAAGRMREMLVGGGLHAQSPLEQGQVALYQWLKRDRGEAADGLDEDAEESAHAPSSGERPRRRRRR